MATLSFFFVPLLLSLYRASFQERLQAIDSGIDIDPPSFTRRTSSTLPTTTIDLLLSNQLDHFIRSFPFDSMVHRTSEDSPYIEEAPVRRFSSSLSRKNSSVGSNYGYYQDEFIFYRPPDKDYFEGPFTEIQCQYWYKEGCFYNQLEFRFGSDGRVETLESLKERNGRECPFQEGRGKPPPSTPDPASELMVKMCMTRVIALAEELEKLKGEREKLQMQRKIEIDSLTNRVKQLMEKDTSNVKHQRETERKLAELHVELADLTESVTNSAMSMESVTEKTNDHDIAFCENRSISERTAVDTSIGEDVTEVRNELVRLQNSVHSLDQFTFKLSHKVEKLKCKYKVVDIIGEGLNGKDGVFDRLAYLETAVDEIQQAANASTGEKRGEVDEAKEEEKRSEPEKEKEEEVVLPVERANGIESAAEGSIPDEWYSPNGKLSPSTATSDTLTATSFAAASESIAASVTAAWPGPEKMVEVGESTDLVDDWESIDDEEEECDLPWSAEIVKRELVTPPPHEHTVEMVAGDVDKENLEVKMDGGAGHLELLGKGLGLLLQSLEADCEDSATDADIDRLVAAIKGAKMLQIAESLKQHFGKALVCDVCSTGEKKAELRNAIEYFEHLNRGHFKKCGGGDRMLVNQFAYLLEQFKASVPVPIALAKRQYAEREKNKPWLKREGAKSPTRKTPGKRK